MKELKLLLPFIKKYRVKILLGFLFISISNICASLAPRIVGQTIDIIGTENFTKSQIVIQIAYLMGLTAMSGVFSYLTRINIIVASRLIEFDLRNKFFDSVQSKQPSFFMENPTGSLMAHATNDIPASREFLGPAVMFSANSLTMFAFALFFMLKINAEVTLITLLPLPLIALVTFLIGKKVYSRFRDVQEHFADMTSFVQENYSGIRIIKSYVREAFRISEFDKISTEYFRKNMKLIKYQALMMPSIMILVGTSVILVLGIGGYKVIQGAITLGEFTQFFIYLNLLIWPVASIGWITNLIQRASASAERLNRILGPDVEEETSGRKEFINGDIIFDNVEAGYDENIAILKNINLKIKKGSSLGICGMIGSGKSTFAKLIPGIMNNFHGKISIGDTGLNDININSLRKAIGYVSQEPFLFSTTIRENIAFGTINPDETEIEEALDDSCLLDEINNFPEKMNTILGERGITLSGGQKQRTAIARALIRKPDILILDDAFSSVDTETEVKILDNILKKLNGKTLIIVSHRISTISSCENIIVLENGNIKEEGKHNDLIGLKGAYFKISEQQKLASRLDKAV